MDYTHLTAMLVSRGALLTYNAKDQCCFATDHALQPLLDAAQPAFKLFKADAKLRWHSNHVPGTHNFDQENREVFYRMLGDTFFPGDTKFDAKELAVEAEVKKAEELNVPLPADNLDFNQLATRLAKDLPRGISTALSVVPSSRLQQAQRALLGGAVHAKHYTVTAELAGAETTNDVTATHWRLRMGDAWTVPAVELTQAHRGPL